MRLYLDSGPLMRAVEGTEEERGRAIQWLDAAAGSAGAVIASRLSRAECLVLPRRLADPERALLFESFFETSGTILVSITDEILDVATDIRAETRLKFPDAIHAATAALMRADVLLTTDSDLFGLGNVRGVRVANLRTQLPI